MLSKQSSRMDGYLEAIALLGQQEKAVRVTQISKALGVKKSSVTSALRKLSEEGLVEHERYGYVELTASGEKVAKGMIRRHKTLSCFFIQALGIDGETAEEDACKIKHVISPLSMERVTKFIEFIEACPFGEANFSKWYRYFLEHGQTSEECLKKSLRKGK